MSRKQKNSDVPVTPETLPEIPESEAWTYQIEGMKAPIIGKPVENAGVKKAVVIAVLIVAIGLSIFFSVRAIHSETFNFTQTEAGWELTKFSNPGDITELTLDCAENDSAKPLTSIREYAFNCDDKLTSITVGKDVREIDSKSFYSVWNLQTIFVDPANEWYCDVDGVLYDKAQTRVICYPIDHDAYLREKAGYKEELWPDSEGYDDAYVAAVQTYHLPATVETVGALAFNYANLTTVYLPAGLKTIETLAFFKSTNLKTIYTEGAGGVLRSLPDGLEAIGSDAFSYDQALEYMYIPASVKTIGHHAFWDTCFKEDGEVKGVSVMHTALDEAQFKASVETGDHWLPSYDYRLFKKTIDVDYGAERAQ